jgi:hypothetical protein
MSVFNSRTSLSDSGANDPSHYIEVNPRQEASQQTEFGSVIVRFYWNLLADTVTSSYQIRNINASSIQRELLQNPVDPTILNSFYNMLGFNFVQNNVFENDSNTLEENLNREVNRSLLSVKTSVADTLGTGTASIILENFNKQWVVQTKVSPFSDLFGKTIFLKGLYVVIDAQGRFDPNTYYRIFQGSVKGISELDNPLDRKVTLTCRDLTKLLGFSRINVSPAIFNTDITALQGAVPVTSSIFQKGQTNVDIATTAIPLVNTPEWNNQSDKFSLAAFKEMWVRPDSLNVTAYQSDISEVDIILDNYRKTYPKGQASYKLDKQLPGVAENYALIWGDGLFDPVFNTFSDKLKNPVYAKAFNSFQLFTNEFRTRLDIIQDVAGLTYFSTYLDSAGNIHFHPPRFDYIKTFGQINDNPIYPLSFPDGTPENPWIYTLLPGESLSETYSTDEEAICTNLKVIGESDFGITNLIQQVNPTFKRPNVVWWDGMKRYGYREHTIRTASFQDDDSLKTVALSLFMRKFLEIEQMSTTMPMRPEIDIDRPFYVQERGWVYHIRSIAHSYSAGTDEGPGEFSTSIDCYAGRPLDEATLIPANIFKLTTFDNVASVFRQHGFNIDVNQFIPASP